MPDQMETVKVELIDSAEKKFNEINIETKKKRKHRRRKEFDLIDI